MTRHAMTRRRLALLAPVMLAAACPAPYQRLEHDGRTRQYLVHAPSSLDGDAPVLLVLHGGGGNARQVARSTGFDELADDEGFIAVYPDAVEKNWNDGRDAPELVAQREGVDDVGFIRAVVADVAARFAVDEARVYATGISNGGLMSFRLGCDAADLVGAIAPVVGGVAEPLLPACAPAAPVSVMALNGTEDGFVPYDGGFVVGEESGRGRVASIAASLGPFRARAACADPPATATTDAVPDDGTVLETSTWTCADGREVTLHTVVGGGHVWPGAKPSFIDPLAGTVSKEIDGVRAAWTFVSRFRR